MAIKKALRRAFLPAKVLFLFCLVLIFEKYFMFEVLEWLCIPITVSLRLSWWFALSPSTTFTNVSVVSPVNETRVKENFLLAA